jgi:hypothetical protein
MSRLNNFLGVTSNYLILMVYKDSLSRICRVLTKHEAALAPFKIFRSNEAILKFLKNTFLKIAQQTPNF